MWHSVTSSKSHRFWKLPNIFQKPSARILNVCQIIGANRPQVACQDASRCMCRSDKGMGTYVNLQEIWTMIPKQHSLETLQVGTAHFSHTQHVFAYSKSLNLWTYHKSLHSIQNWHITNPKGTLEVQEMVCQTTEALTRSHRPKTDIVNSIRRHLPLLRQGVTTQLAPVANLLPPLGDLKGFRDFEILATFSVKLPTKMKGATIGLLNDDLYLKFCYYQYYRLINFIIVTLILSSNAYLAWSRMSIPWCKQPWGTWALKQRFTKPYPTHNIWNKK